jgi:hypothetical protein
MQTLLATLLLSASALAQAFSMTAQVGNPGSATGSMAVGSQVLHASTTSMPAGSVALPFAFQHAGTHAAGSWSTTISLTPNVGNQQAPLAFTVQGVANATTTPTSPAWHMTAASMDLDLTATLFAPQPCSGRLYLVFQGAVHNFGDSRVDVDIGADGTFELQTQAWMLGHTWSPLRLLEYPVAIGASGCPLRIRCHCDASSTAATGWNTDSASMTVEAQFFPGQAVVQAFDATGATVALHAVHAPNDAVTLLGPQGLTSVFVLGTQSMRSPVPFLPHLMQLVTVDAFTIADLLTVQMPPMAAGTALYCQAFAVDSGGQWHGSNSLRALWP